MPIAPKACRRALAIGTVCAVALASAPLAQVNAATETITPLNQTVTITTVGWGHGRGMSQYGAKEAAEQGLKYDKILAFYYPGTKLTGTSNQDIRVWIKADDATLNVAPASGLHLKDSDGKDVTLPTGSNYKQWRITTSSSKQKAAYLDAKGAWKSYTPKGLSTTKTWYFHNTSSKTVKLVLPGGTSRTYRGSIAHVLSGTSGRSVNYVPLESYLRSVVPAEMPASWSAEAVKAQTVAARSYALRYKANHKGEGGYDVCDTTACQAYKGTSSENSATDKAITATAGKILTYKNANDVAWAEFSSSNGGYSAKGDYPYLVAKADPYDTAERRYWALPFTATTIQKKYPTIGTFKSITVKARDGKGKWGGRVTSITITGSKKAVTVSGTSFKSTMGLRETLMIITSGLATSTENYKRWQSLGGSPGTKLGPPTASETSVNSGLISPFEKGTLYWTSATGSRLLSGPVLTAYLNATGPKSALGFPSSDVRAITTERVAGMKKGTEATFAKGLVTCPSTAKQASDCLVSFG